MSTIKLVISDLHLADGSPLLDCFGSEQQAAFSGFLHTVSSELAPPRQGTTLELIVNGDCFDFLVTTPYAPHRLTDATVALQKLEKILAAHAPFFAELRSFLALPGRSITFLLGNHDLELCFADVRARICEVLVGKKNATKIFFCRDRAYRPLPDVYIEHGNHYDAWNRTPDGLWDEQGRSLAVDPPSLLLPLGTWYYQLVTYLITLHYPFIDHFAPTMSHTRQIALLCLLDPPLLLEMARRSLSLLSTDEQADPIDPTAQTELVVVGELVQLTSEELADPVRVFEQVILDFVALRQGLFAPSTDGQGQTDVTAPATVSSEEMMEYFSVREALALPRMRAIAAICTSVDTDADSGGSVAQGLAAVLAADATLRYALAGHTHSSCVDPLNGQVYINTGSWVARYAQPAPDEVTPELVAWLQSPDWEHIPLRDVTSLPFALITANNGPASANLCVWEGGLHGRFRIVA